MVHHYLFGWCVSWCACINYKTINKKDLEILRNIYINNKLNINYIVGINHKWYKINMNKFKKLVNSDNKNKLYLMSCKKLVLE